MPDFLPHLNRTVEDLERAARDGAYAAVGFGILAFNKAQVRRREIAHSLQEGSTDVGARLAPHLNDAGERLGPQVVAVRAQVADLLATLDRQVEPARHLVSAGVDEVERHLPEPARELLDGARVATRESEARLRRAVGLDGRPGPD